MTEGLTNRDKYNEKRLTEGRFRDVVFGHNPLSVSGKK